MKNTPPPQSCEPCTAGLSAHHPVASSNASHLHAQSPAPVPGDEPCVPTQAARPAQQKEQGCNYFPRDQCCMVHRLPGLSAGHCRLPDLQRLPGLTVCRVCMRPKLCRVAAVAQRIGSSIAGAVDPSSATAVAYWAFHSAKNVFFASQVLTALPAATATTIEFCLRP